MPYSSNGTWSVWAQPSDPLNLDPIQDDGWRSPAPVFTPVFDGESAPGVATPRTEHADFSASWIPERREMRLYVVSVVGQFVNAASLKEHLARARATYGEVNFISLVFRQGDYAAYTNASANLRGWLARNGFRKIDSYNGGGFLLEKDLNRKEPPKIPQPKPEPVSMTPEAQAKRYREAGINIPPYLQRELASEKATQDAIEKDPARLLAEVNARIAELKRLKAEGI